MEGNVILHISKQDPKTGKIIIANLERPRLKEGCFPTIFPNCPKYLSQTTPLRKSRDEKLKDLDQDHLFQAIEESKKFHLNKKRANSFIDFEEFLCKFKTFHLPKGWFSLKNEKILTLFKLENRPGPCMSWSIVIDEQLTVNTYLYSESINITLDDITPTLKTPFISTSLEEINELLNVIDTTLQFPYTMTLRSIIPTTDTDNLY